MALQGQMPARIKCLTRLLLTGVGAYNELGIGTQKMIADNLVFCHECHSIFELQKDKNGEPVKVRRKKKTYKEIAMLNGLSEEERVRGALQKGCEEMREKLI